MPFPELLLFLIIGKDTCKHSTNLYKAIKLKVLLIEDDKDLSSLVGEYLTLEGIECEMARTGTEGLALAKNAKGTGYDCIILDLNLPMLDGLSVCKNLRHNNILTPVIMLTARDKLDDKLEGFAVGTNDYLCKPFEMAELIARIKALSSRNILDGTLKCGDLVIDIVTKTVKLGDKILQLTNTEYKILQLLMSKSPKIIDKRKIAFEVWGDEPPDSDSLKVHIHKLRKIVDPPDKSQLIHTVIGHGYVIKDNG